MMDPRMAMAMRYGGRYMPQPQAVAPAPRPNRPPGVLLDENKLLIELRVDVVRLKEATTNTAAGRQVAQNVQ
jgi:hypothetical protein